jgi:glycosyltransferase involved in cell wall biosynthesis
MSDILLAEAPPLRPAKAASAMTDALLFQWGFSTLYGWGVFGLNLLRHWRAAAGTPVYCGGHLHVDSLAGMDPLAIRALMPALVESSDLRGRWAAMMAESDIFDGVVLHGLGNRFAGVGLSTGGVRGRTTCAMMFFEDTIMPNAMAIGGAYDLIISGSSWCEDILRAHGLGNVTTVIQGVDPSIFHPAPRSNALAGRFAVFSGGKLEHRKAQDLVLQAFVPFAQRHPEAVLVTAWHSPWPEVAKTLNVNPAIAPITADGQGSVDIAGWAAANGLSADQFIDVGSIPNHLMARVLREMDVAVFPNRCEGGTNLVAMECMACGVPTILSDNTGHRDLTALGASYVLNKQGRVASQIMGTEGWGESDVDEIIAALEAAWDDREEANRIGQAGARAMSELSWRRQIGQLCGAMASVCG